MSKTPIAWYRSPSEDAPDGEAVYGPEFIGVARRKLEHLLASGWRVSGVSIERANQDGTVSRGAVTTGGMVLWWHAGQPQQEPHATPELFAQQIEAAMRYADASLSHDQFVTLVLYLKARAS